MYKYWQPVVLEEHYLFSKEVAQAWGVYSLNEYQDRAHAQMVYAILEKVEYEERKNPLYYETKQGLVRVFSQKTIALGFHRLATFSQEEPQYMFYYDGGKKYKYRFKGAIPWIKKPLEV